MPLLLGKPLAEAILRATGERIRTEQLTPGLAVILVGHDPGSEIYVRLKETAAANIGIKFELHRFDEAVDQTEVGECIKSLNKRTDIHGIIIQLPLPSGWPTDALVALIDPAKDADGFHPVTLERYLGGDDTFIPVLPRAIRELILSAGVPLAQEKSIALVNSALFGRVIGQMLARLGLDVTVFVRGVQAIDRSLLREARVLVSVCGEPGLVDLTDLRLDALVVDAGITRVGDTVQGDVVGDQDSFLGWITPIPGGVGPLTIACLLERVGTLSQKLR